MEQEQLSTLLAPKTKIMVSRQTFRGCIRHVYCAKLAAPVRLTWDITLTCTLYVMVIFYILHILKYAYSIAT